MSVREVFNTLSRFHFLPLQLRSLFLARFFFNIGQAINLIAGPLWLFTAGQNYPLWTHLPLESWGKGLLTVLLFLIGTRVTQILFSSWIVTLLKRLGFTYALILGELLTIVRFLPALWMNEYPVLLFLTMVISGFAVHLFWTSYHVLFTTEAIEPEIGTEVGSLEFIVRLAQVISPLVSAFTIVTFGYSATFAVSAIFFLISICVLFQLPNYRSQAHWSWQSFWQWLRRRDHRRLLTSMGGFAWEETGFDIFWPIFLLLSYGRLESVGYVLSGATLLSLLLVYLSGWVFDHRRNSQHWIHTSGLLTALLWIPRAFFIHSPVIIVLNDAIDRLVHGVYGTLFYASVVWRARGRDVLHFYINREIAISFTTIVGSILTIVLLFMSWSWSIIFLSFMVGIFISLLFRKDRS